MLLTLKTILNFFHNAAIFQSPYGIIVKWNILVILLL